MFKMFFEAYIRSKTGSESLGLLVVPRNRRSRRSRRRPVVCSSFRSRSQDRAAGLLEIEGKVQKETRERIFGLWCRAFLPPSFFPFFIQPSATAATGLDHTRMLSSLLQSHIRRAAAAVRRASCCQHTAFTKPTTSHLLAIQKGPPPHTVPTTPPLPSPCPLVPEAHAASHASSD